MTNDETKPFKLAAVGGTFDALHRGHKILLRRAFLIADRVLVGLSKNSFVKRLSKPHRVDGYSKRKGELERYLRRHRLLSRARIVPLEDRFGPTITDPRIDVIVLSDETKCAAGEINRVRRRNGLKPLAVVSIRMVLAEDFTPVSSRRIRRKEMNREGYLASRSSPK